MYSSDFVQLKILMAINQSLQSYYCLKPYQICYKNIISRLGILQQSTVVNISDIQPFSILWCVFVILWKILTKYMLGAYFVSAIYKNIGVKMTDFRYYFIIMDKIVDMILSV